MLAENEEGRYSRNSYARNSYGGGSYGGSSYGNSYDNSYDGYSGRHYVRGHYSRAEGKEGMESFVENMMREAQTDHEKELIQRFKQAMDEM